MATHNAEDSRFTFISNTAQGFGPGPPPNPGAPISPLHALGGGNAPSYEMFGSNVAYDGAGRQPVMNMDRSNPERQHSSSPRTYSSPYGNPELDYVYLGSPKSLSPFLTPGFSFNASHAVQPAEELQFLDQHAVLTETDHHYLTDQQDGLGYVPVDDPFNPSIAERFNGDAGNIMEPKAVVEQYLMAQGSESELRHDGVWANLESVLFLQDSPQQFDLPPMEPFNFDQPAGGLNHHQADDINGASSSSNFIPHSDAGKIPSTAAHHYPAIEVGDHQNSNQQGLYPFTDQLHGNSRTDLVDMEQPGAPSSKNHSPSQREIMYTQLPYGYVVHPNDNTTAPALDLHDASSQRTRFTRPENNFRDQAQSSHQVQEQQRFARPENDFRDHGQSSQQVQSELQQVVQSEQQQVVQSDQQQVVESEQQQGVGGGSAYNAPGVAAINEYMMGNDFLQLMSSGMLGMGHLGEPCWALQLLNMCAAAISSQNISQTQHLMVALNELASPQGDVNQRFAAYGLKALFCRITDNSVAMATFARPRHSEQEISFGPDRVHRALVRFHDYVPWHQNCYTASCQTLLEVCAGKSRLHLIDIGAGRGIEWPIFIDALVSRAGGPPSILRITMIRDLRREEQNLRYAKPVNSEAADFMTRLVKFASVLGLHVEVNMVTKALECVMREDLRLRHGEVLAVVCQFRLHRLVEEVPELPSNAHMLPSRPPLSPRDEFMDFIFKLNPQVFILSDNNSDHSSLDFLTRFQSAMHYWWHFYESLDMGYNGKHAEERQIIEFEAGTVMLNQVACEGIARIERNETYPVWAQRVQRAGFVPKDLSAETKTACETLIQNHSEFWDLNFDEPNMVNLRWRKLGTTFTSVWTTPGFCSKTSCKCSMLHN